MSLFKPTLKNQKDKLQEQIYLIECKVKHTDNYRQKQALRHKRDKLIVKSNNLLKEYYKIN